MNNFKPQLVTRLLHDEIPTTPLPMSERLGEDSDYIPWILEFRVVGTSDIIQAPMGETLIIGREDPDHAIMPQVDLTPYDGRSMGVSRQHVAIKAGDNRLTVTDLNSANGTYINGHAVPPQKPTRIHDGDRLRLGKLELQLRFVIKPSDNEQTRVGMGNPLNVPSLGAGQRILIAHENAEVCRLLTYVVKKANFTPVQAANAEQALQLMQQQLPQGMIVEFDMSQGRGLDILKYYMRLAKRPMPSMVVVASSGGYFTERAIEAGADMVLWEPVAMEQLISGLKTMAQLMNK